MAAAGQNKSHFGIGQQLDFENRTPGCHVIFLRSNGKDRHPNIQRRDGLPFHAKPPFGQIKELHAKIGQLAVRNDFLSQGLNAVSRQGMFHA